MSNEQKDCLKAKLLQLECHFTWKFQDKEFLLENMKLKLENLPENFVKYKAMPYNQLAFVNYLQGNYEEALQNLKTAEKILRENHGHDSKSRSIITYGNYAWLYYHKGQFTDAETYLDKVEEICKQFPKSLGYAVMTPEVYGEKGWALLNYSVSYYKKAEECFLQALEQDPLDIEWNLGLAIILFRNNENCESIESVTQLRRVLKLDPDRSIAMVLLALKLQLSNQLEEGFTLVEKALQISSARSHVIRYAAKFYRKAGNVDKAIELLKRAMGINPGSSFLHHQIGLCYRWKLKKDQFGNIRCGPTFQGKTELIEQCKYHFRKAFEINPFFIAAKLDFANIHVQLKEYQEAERIFTDLLKLENISNDYKQSVYLFYGLFQQKQNESDSKVASLFLEGLKIREDSWARQLCRSNLQAIAEKLNTNSKDSKTFYFLGLMHQLDGEKPKAIEYFEKAAKFDQTNKEYADCLFELCNSMEQNNVPT